MNSLRQKRATADQISVPDFRILIETAEKISKTTADTHQKFLEFSNELTQGYSETFALQTKLLEHAISRSEGVDYRIQNSKFRIQNSEFRLPAPVLHFPAKTALNLPQVLLLEYWDPNLLWLMIIRPEYGYRMNL